MTGKTQSVELQRIASKWGIPLAGRTVDFFAVMRSVCKFLEKNGPILSVVMESDTEDPEGPLVVEYLKAKIANTREDAALKKLRRLEKEGALCQRDFIHNFLSRLANRIRSAGEQAQRNWGEDGFEIFHQIEMVTREDIARLAATNPPDNQIEEPAVKPKAKAKQKSGVKRPASAGPHTIRGR